MEVKEMVRKGQNINAHVYKGQVIVIPGGGGEISPEAIKEAVDEYLEANPPAQGTPGKDGADGKDGAPGKDGQDGYTPVKGVDYFTPAEVEEIAQQAAGMVEVPEADIPKELPNPFALNLTGAVNATYDGSKPVAIVIPQGGGSEWRFIRTVTIPEDITTDTSGVAFAEQSGGGTTFAFDTDENGKPFELTELVVYAYAATPHTISDFRINLSESVPKYVPSAILSAQLTIGTAGKLTYAVSWSTLLQFDDAEIPRNKTVHSVSYGAQFAGGVKNNVQSSAKVMTSDLGVGSQLADIDKIRRCNCLMGNLKDYGFSAGSTFSFYGR